MNIYSDPNEHRHADLSCVPDSRSLAGVLRVLFAAAAIVVSLLNPAIAQVDQDKAFRSIQSAPWYDSETDDFAAPPITEAKDNSIREDGFKRGSTTTNSNSFWDAFWDWFDWGGNGGTWNIGTGGADIFSMIAITTLAIVIVTILVVLIVHLLKSSGIITSKSTSSLKKLEIDPVKVEDLPFEVERSDLNPLDEALRLLRAGDARKSIIYLYGYMLLVLDQARRIHLQKGKTNRMYLAELKGEQPLHSLLERTILVFEEAFFGRYAVTAEKVQEIWAELEQFHSLLEVGPHDSKQAEVQ